MKCIDEIRRQRLSQLIDEATLSLSDINEKLGRDRRDATISQVINKSPNTRTGKVRNLGDEQARKIESVFGKPTGWMDRDPDFDRALDALSVANRQLSEMSTAERPGVYQLWPFGRISIERIRRLPADELRRVESAVLGLVRDWEEQSTHLGNQASA